MNKTVNKDFINITDSYKFYKSKSKFVIPVNLSEYRRVINAFHKLVMKHIIEGGDLVYLPLKMGTLVIKGNINKPKIVNGVIKGLPIRWSKTKELWDSCPEAKERGQVVYCTNEETGGVRYKFQWNTKKVWAKYKSLYSFRPSRANKRAVYRQVINGKEYANS